MAYDIGDDITLTCTLAVGGVNTDPTTLTLEVQDPSGNKDTYTYAAAQITRTAAGVYTKTIAVDEAGEWYYRWASTGTAKGAGEGALVVNRRMVSA